MNPSEIPSELLRLMLDVVRPAIDVIRKEWDGELEVQLKGPDDPVTKVDLRVNELLLSRLAEYFPGVPVVSEESPPPEVARLASAEQVFYLDPLDGTQELVAGRREVTVLLGLVQGTTARAGVVLCPRTSRAWIGEVGVGALEVEPDGTLRRLRVSKQERLRAARLIRARGAAGPEVQRMLAELAPQSVREQPGIGLKGLEVARGASDIYVAPYPLGRRWDVCALDALVTAAGGRVTDPRGVCFDYRSRGMEKLEGLVITNRRLHEPVLRGLRRAGLTEAPKPCGSTAQASRDVSLSQEQLERALRVIPGGAQLEAKQHRKLVPGVSPLYAARSEGCRVWDLDGNEFLDCCMGLGAVLLGHAHPAITAAVSRQARRGICGSLPTVLEAEVAEQLVALFPGSEMVRFGKNGSDVTSGAVRLARAVTGRPLVACCGYHGWHDWYIGATPFHAGVPQSVRDLTRPFRFNDLEDLEGLFCDRAGHVAAVILEPVGYEEPAAGFLAGVRELCDRHGAVLIFDEVASGLRVARGGAGAHYGVTPDLTCLSKGLANGLPLSALVGIRDLMQDLERIFFSFTYADEALGLAACRTTLEVMRQEDVVAHIWRHGRRLQEGYNQLARTHGLEGHTRCIGLPPRSLVVWTDGEGEPSLALKTLFIQETSRRGVLCLGAQNPSLAHDDRAVSRLLSVHDEVLSIVRNALQQDSLMAVLEGPLVSAGMRTHELVSSRSASDASGPGASP